MFHFATLPKPERYVRIWEVFVVAARGLRFIGYQVRQSIRAELFIDGMKFLDSNIKVFVKILSQSYSKLGCLVLSCHGLSCQCGDCDYF
jgi:hypothetical protein